MQRTRPFVGHVVIFVSDGGSNAARDTSFGGAGVGQPSTLREVRDVNGGGGFVVLGLGGLGVHGVQREGVGSNYHGLDGR